MGEYPKASKNSKYFWIFSQLSWGNIQTYPYFLSSRAVSPIWPPDFLFQGMVEGSPPTPNGCSRQGGLGGQRPPRKQLITGRLNINTYTYKNQNLKNRKLKRKRKQKRNGWGHLRGGASRPSRRLPHFRFCFRFRFNFRFFKFWFPKWLLLTPVS